MSYTSVPGSDHHVLTPEDEDLGSYDPTVQCTSQIIEPRQNPKFSFEEAYEKLTTYREYPHPDKIEELIWSREQFHDVSFVNRSDLLSTVIKHVDKFWRFSLIIDLSSSLGISTWYISATS